MMPYIYAVGRFLAEVLYNFPLSIYFLDEERRDSTDWHLQLGARFWLSLLVLIGTIAAILVYGPRI